MAVFDALVPSKGGFPSLMRPVVLHVERSNDLGSREDRKKALMLKIVKNKQIERKKHSLFEPDTLVVG